MKHTKQNLTVERANLIQAEWMALDCNASEVEKQRVFSLMEELPKNYFSVSADGKSAVAMYSNQPVCQGLPVAECVRYYGKDMDRRVAWQGSKFIPAPV